jgi:peptidoglycan/LPS O-acetylase OafA/YrhL
MNRLWLAGVAVAVVSLATAVLILAVGPPSQFATAGLIAIFGVLLLVLSFRARSQSADRRETRLPVKAQRLLVSSVLVAFILPLAFFLAAEVTGYRLLPLLGFVLAAACVSVLVYSTSKVGLQSSETAY